MSAYPFFLNVSGKVSLRQQLEEHGVNVGPTMPLFDALVINTLQSLLSSLVILQTKVAELEGVK